MEKLRIASVLASEILSREELKRVFGGSGSQEESDKWCVGLITESGMASCWYTKGSPEDLAKRVYPGQKVEIHQVGCDNGGCIMN